MVLKLKVARTIWSVSLNKEWIAWNKNKVKKFQTKKFWKLMLEQYEYSCCKLFELSFFNFTTNKTYKRCYPKFKKYVKQVEVI